MASEPAWLAGGGFPGLLPGGSRLAGAKGSTMIAESEDVPHDTRTRREKKEKEEESRQREEIIWNSVVLTHASCGPIWREKKRAPLSLVKTKINKRKPVQMSLLVSFYYSVVRVTFFLFFYLKMCFAFFSL